MSAMLYLVPTPIGNLSDISERCREVLAQADFIAAEDTRVTLRLLNHLGLKKPLVSYYEHNKAASGPRIVERILAGETCALVSDAGSPAISDPGEDLVRLCAEAGAEFVKTSTGYAPSGATLEDVRLMRASVPDRMQVKAAGGVRTLDALLAFRAAGCARCGATATEAILQEAERRFAEKGTLD